MKRSARMNRGRGFARPEPRPAKVIGDGYTVRPRAAAVAVADLSAQLVVPVPKVNALQHEGYMNIVRRMACAHCGRPGPSQFCHSDEGKGLAIKSDCRKGWPGCADAPGRIGCHSLVGSTGAFKREHKRTLEDKLAAKTRREVFERGLWPKTLPYWPGDQFPNRGPAAQPEGATDGQAQCPDEKHTRQEERAAREEGRQEVLT
jgi:hypothetical protein